MMQMAFYRAWSGGISGNNRFFDRIISLRTLHWASHSEIVFSDGMFFSSSPRDGGCRLKWITPDSDWVLVPLPFHTFTERSIRVKAEKLVDRKCGYDWRGIWGFGIPFLGHDGNKFFCSEVCLELCQGEGWFLDAGKPYKNDPGDLASYLKKTLPRYSIETSML
jgi:hypothetical protein